MVLVSTLKRFNVGYYNDSAPQLPDLTAKRNILYEHYKAESIAFWEKFDTDRQPRSQHSFHLLCASFSVSDLYAAVNEQKTCFALGSLFLSG